MKKRGIGWSHAIGWAIGILIVLVVIAVLFFPQQLLEKGRDAAIYFGLGALPEDLPPEFEGSLIPPDLKPFLDGLFSDIDNAQKTQQDCLIDVSTMPQKGFGVYLRQDEVGVSQTGDDILIAPDKKPIGGGLPKSRRFSVNGLNPCIIFGKQEVTNFYSCIQSPPPVCDNIFKPVPGMKLLDTSEADFIFKTYQNSKHYFCTIKIYDDKNNNCDRPTGPSLDDDCLDNIKSKYNPC